MRAYISDLAGNEWKLPELIFWDVTHALEGEADCYTVRVTAAEGLIAILPDVCRFRAEGDGGRIFTGVIDEYELISDEGGRTATIRGRSLAALLMDNEATAAQYWGAGLEFILKNHVSPWGIGSIKKKAMAAAPRFDVASGESQWGVLREFCRFCGGVEPRFDREGTLLLDGSHGEKLRVNADTPITAMRVTDRRYGVISEAVVYNRGVIAKVENAPFKARGGSARRVITVPRRTAYDAMRYTASYQIDCSARDAYSVELTIPAPFAAFAGDEVELAESPLGIRGSFLCYNSRCRTDGSGAVTRLKLRREK